jgi:nucleoside phosphorylase
VTFLRASYGDALAVEMEGHGVMQAAHQRNVDALVVRGISDLLDGKAESDRTGWQPRARGRGGSDGAATAQVDGR